MSYAATVNITWMDGSQATYVVRTWAMQDGQFMLTMHNEIVHVIPLCNVKIWTVGE